MKLLFLPFSIVSGLIAGLIGKKIFEQIWGLIDEEEPPDSKHRDVDIKKLAVSVALQGAIFTMTRKLVDHQARKAFAGATGTWPGDKRPDAE